MTITRRGLFKVLAGLGAVPILSVAKGESAAVALTERAAKETQWAIVREPIVSDDGVIQPGLPYRDSLYRKSLRTGQWKPQYELWRKHPPGEVVAILR